MRRFANRQKDGYYYQLIQSSEWHRLRLRKWKAENGLCERCRQHGIVTPAVAVHHIIPVLKDRNRYNMRQRCFSYENLMCVCQDCHDALHAELDSKSKNSLRDGVRSEANEMSKRMLGVEMDRELLEE